MANTFDCRSMTFASLFLSLFGLRVSEGLYNFEPTVNGLELDAVQALFNAAREINLTANWYFPPDIDILVIDEYSTLAVSMLKLVLLRLHHGREATKRRLDIVLLISVIRTSCLPFNTDTRQTTFWCAISSIMFFN